jgi:negative regulator of sigma E activity
MSAPTDDRLMRLYDDELGADEAARLEQRIVDDPESAAVLRGLQQVGSLLREAAAEQGAAADDIAVRVMACIDAEESTSGGAPLEAPDNPSSSGESNVTPLPRRWRHAVPALAGVLALAAAAVLVFRSGAVSHHPAGSTQASTQAMQPQEVQKPASPAPAAAHPVVADSSPPVAIETVDFGSHDGAIFMVSAGQGSTPVVWLTDEPAVHGGRTKPL